MRRSMVVLCACLTASCGSTNPAEQAQKDVDFLESNGGSSAELCEAYGKLAKSQLANHDDEAWKAAKSNAEIHCQSAAFGR